MPLSTPIRYTLFALLGLVALVALAGIYFLFFFDWNHARGYIGRQASGAAGREIALNGDITVEWGWPVTHFNANDITVANIEGAREPQMMSFKTLDLKIDLKQTLFDHVTLPEITLIEPVINLEKDKDGNANWNFTDNPAGAVATAPVPDERSEFPSIGKLFIQKGKLTYRDAKEGTDIALDADTASGGASDETGIKLSGKGTYQRQPFSINMNGGSVLALRESSEPYPIDISASAGKTSMTLKGTMDDPIAFEGMNAMLTVKGANAADLFPLTGVVLPPTPPYDIKGRLTFTTDGGKPKEWRFEKFSGRMGDSDLSGDVVFDVGRERPKLTGKFVSNKLDFDDLGGFIGATPDTNETVSDEQKQKAAQEEAAPTVIPDAPLDISRLAAMDADVEFTGKQIMSPSLPLDDFYMKVLLDDRLLQVKPVRFGTAGGDIETYLTVNARAEPVRIDSDFRFKRLQLSRLFAGLSDTLGQKNVSEGYIGGAAKLTGTGKSLHEMLSTSNGTIGIGMEGGQLSNLLVELIGLDVAQGLGFFLEGDEPVPVRCIVSDFAVKDGLATTRAFVVDTKDTNIAGEGTLNLKDEALDLTLDPQPKDFSLMSARSPISVTGTLKNPNVGPKTGPLAARGAVAGGLSLVAPVAALVAFIDIGLGEDSNCSKLLAEMKQDTGQKGKKLVPENSDVPGEAEKKK